MRPSSLCSVRASASIADDLTPASWCSSRAATAVMAPWSPFSATRARALTADDLTRSCWCSSRVATAVAHLTKLLADSVLVRTITAIAARFEDRDSWVRWYAFTVVAALSPRGFEATREGA